MGIIEAAARPAHGELPDSSFRNLEPSELEFQRELTRTLPADLVEGTESSSPVGAKNDPAQIIVSVCVIFPKPFPPRRLLKLAAGGANSASHPDECGIPPK
jgi:hypothetical protein